jgi:hypothetical protein
MSTASINRASCVRGHNFSTLARDYKRYRKRALKDQDTVAEIQASDVSLLLEPKDHTHQVTSRCAIAFARAKYGNDLILADFNLAVGWSTYQTAKFSSYRVQGKFDV